MSKKRLLLVLGGIFVLALGAAAYFLMARQPEEGSDKNQPLAIAPTAEINQLETALNSPDIATQSKALAPGLDEQYRQQGKPAFIPSMRIDLDDASFRQTGNSATVEAALSNGERWRVHLVRQAGNWYIWNTEKR